MDLNEFLDEMRMELNQFELFWKEENKKDPETFPMKFDKNNAGIWFEQFMIFSDRM